MPLLIKAEISKLSTDVLTELLKNLINEGIINPKNITIRTDFHCTLLYTEKTCYIPKIINNYVSIHDEHMNKIYDIDIFDENAIVLLLDSRFLMDRNKEILLESKATPQHKIFIPHITIGYLNKGFFLRNDVQNEIKTRLKNYTIDFIGEKGKFIA
jgi:2'-5' RNA ligase